VQVGVRSKYPGPSLPWWTWDFWGCHLSRDLNRPALKTQSPEQGGGCRCLPNLLHRLWFSLHQLWPYPPQPLAWRLSSRFRPLSPGRL